MKLYHRIVDLFFRRQEERTLSDVLSLVTIIIILNLIDYPDDWNMVMVLLSILMLAFVMYQLLDRLFLFLLGNRNIKVGFGSYMVGAAVIATVNTIVL